MIAMHPVISSNVESVGHDPVKNVLSVKFKTGQKVYSYPGVSVADHAAIMKAPSIGSHLAKNITSKIKPL